MRQRKQSHSLSRKNEKILSIFLCCLPVPAAQPSFVAELTVEKQNKIKYDLVLFCCAPYRIGQNQVLSVYVIRGTQPSAGTTRCQKKKKKSSVF